jgi:Fe2+ or Zn2+ uptake regulation protein
MEQYVGWLKEKGIRVTPQRVEVLKILSGNDRHLSAEEIYERLKLTMPAVSLATVYTVLELLKENNMVREMNIRASKACFDIRVDRHHHFLCRSCGKIFDIDIHPCPALKQGEVKGHRIEELHGYFYGLCKHCRSDRK